MLKHKYAGEILHLVAFDSPPSVIGRSQSFVGLLSKVSVCLSVNCEGMFAVSPTQRSSACVSQPNY